MLKYLLRTTWFRGRGAQRIRRVMLFQTAAGADSYANATGFVNGLETGGANIPSVRNFIKGRIRNFVIRTIEPRTITIAAIPNLVANSKGFLDFTALSDNVINGTQRVAIKLYHVKLNGGVFESANMAAGVLPNGLLLPFEIEYTSHSGAEA